MPTANTSPTATLAPKSGRPVAASAIGGVALDCDLATGAKVGGGTATDNAPALNLRLAAATAAAPVALMLDGPTAVAGPLILPAAGHVLLDATPGSGMFVRSGSACNGIQNFAATDLANDTAWNPGSAQSIAGKAVTIRNLEIVGNRGTYPSGNVPSGGNLHGTLPGHSPSPDARSNYSNRFWLSGIALVGLEDVRVENTRVYDAPAFGMNFYHIRKLRVVDCRVDAADPTVAGNTDGIHINGGCSDVQIRGARISVGDDPIAVNVDEGDGTGGGDIAAVDCCYVNCASGGRVYGTAASARKVTFRGITGTVQRWGLQLGNENVAPSGTDTAHSVLMDGWMVGVTAPTLGGGLAYLTANIGLFEMRSCKVVDPTAAHTLVQLGSTTSAPAANSVRVAGCEVHRSSGGSSAVTLLAGATGLIADLVIDGFRITDTGTFSDVPYLINLTGTGPRITRLRIDSLDMAHAGALCNDFSKIGSISGPGCAGLVLPDSVMADGWPYLSENNGGVPAIKIGGVVKLFTTSAAVAHAHFAGRFVANGNVSGSNLLGTPISVASDAALQAGSAFTLGCFFRPTNSTDLGSQLQVIAGKWNQGTPAGQEFMLYTGNTLGDAHGIVFNGSTAYDIASDSPVVVGTWYHLCLVYTGTQIRFYVNATEQAASPLSATAQSATTEFRIGAAPAPTVDWATSGDITQVYKYNFAFSPTQVAYMWNSGAGRSKAEILAETGLDVSVVKLLVCFENTSVLGEDSSSFARTLTNALTVGPTASSGPG